MAIRNASQYEKQESDAAVIACKRLWASVMRSATDDVLSAPSAIFHYHGAHDADKKEFVARTSKMQALEWIFSDDCGVGAFLWCCDVLDLDADAVRDKVRAGRFVHSKLMYAVLRRLEDAE